MRRNRRLVTEPRCERTVLEYLVKHNRRCDPRHQTIFVLFGWPVSAVRVSHSVASRPKRCIELPDQHWCRAAVDR